MRSTASSVLAEALLLDVLKLLGQLVEALLRLDFFPGREHDRVLEGRMGLVHASHGRKRLCTRLGLAADLAAGADPMQIIRDLAPTLMLNKEHLDQLLVRTAALANFRKDVLLF